MIVDFERSCRAGEEPPKLNARLLCPRCKDGITSINGRILCSNTGCLYAEEGFPVIDGQPVLIDFSDSIFQRSNYADGNGSVILRDHSQNSLKARLNRLVSGKNTVAADNCGVFLSLVKAGATRPRVLVIGGGVLGQGAETLYSERGIELIGTDVYASSYTSLICDAHKLPFETASFDGVWMQAVLEHVLEPHVVVSEIHRVL